MFHAITLTLLLTTNFVASDGARLREMRKEAIKDRLTSTQSAEVRRMEFKDRLSEIKDERKRLIVQNVSLRFTNVKNKWVEHWNKILDRLGAVLDKIETEFGSNDATAEAQTAISEAQALVDALSDKEYDIVFEEETTLKTDMQSLVSEFKNDLKTTKEAVKNAKGKVQEAWRQSRPENEEES